MRRIDPRAGIAIAAVAAVVVLVAAIAATGIGRAPEPSPPPPPIALASVSTAPTSMPSPLPSSVASPTPTSLPTGPVAGPLDGMFMSRTLAARNPIAVMIDDNVAARPQAGFNAASIVYQAPADGGEDRYMLVFQEGDARTVGPVRSGRPFFLRWAIEYHAMFGHYGGDAQTLYLLPSVDKAWIWNLDGIGGAGAAYHRVSYRAAPHNAYTSTESLRRLGTKRGAPGWDTALAVRTFRDASAPDARGRGARISVPYLRGASSYDYDPATNQYARSVAGRPQIDANDHRRVTATNVIVLFMSLKVDPNSEPGHHRPLVGLFGSGRALVFNEGHVIEGRWTKRDTKALTRIVDASGKDIPLVRGRTFIQVVPTGAKVVHNEE